MGIYNELTRREFMKISAGMTAYLCAGPLPFAWGSSEPKVAGYPIASGTPKTTLQDTVKLSQSFSGTITPPNLQQISLYDQYGYGVWSSGGPLAAEKRNDIMADTFVYPVTNKSAKLARFFTITDIHITDKESPSQLIYMQPANIVGNEHHMNLEAGATSVYSPTMLYTTHVLDAAIQTVNALHQHTSIDFGLSLGDTCNSTQYNELRWYIDVMDGNVITPSSGAHVGADRIDYQKPYKAAGLDQSIPWYQTVGNHDHFWLGSIPPDAGDLRKSCISDEVIALPNILANPNNIYGNSPNLTAKY